MKIDETVLKVKATSTQLPPIYCMKNFVCIFYNQLMMKIASENVSTVHIRNKPQLEEPNLGSKVNEWKVHNPITHSYTRNHMWELLQQRFTGPGWPPKHRSLCFKYLKYALAMPWGNWYLNLRLLFHQSPFRFESLSKMYLIDLL